jgi:DNA-binding transcriptional LysR family regulator
VSVTKLIEEMATLLLADFDAETRFELRAARGRGPAAYRTLLNLSNLSSVPFDTVACLPDRLVTRHIETGRLVRVLEAWCGPISGFFLYYPSHRHTPIALRAFIDFLRSDSNAINQSGENSAST